MPRLWSDRGHPDLQLSNPKGYAKNRWYKVDLTAIIAVVVIIVVQLLLIRPMGRYIVQTYYKERSRFDAFF